MKTILTNPAIITGLLRAVMLAAVSFGVRLLPEQQVALLDLATAVMIVLSLALTGVTVANTRPKEESINTPERDTALGRTNAEE